MKNNSWQHPFPTFGDKFFDSNKDGKLDTVETVFRDMHLNEMSRKANEYDSRQKSNLQHSSENNNTSKNVNKKTESVSSGIQMIGIFLVIIIMIVGIVVAIKADGSMFITTTIIAIAVGISASILRSVGLSK